MLTCASLVKSYALRLLLIFVSALIIKCDDLKNHFNIKEKHYCPFIETLSFGSDIDIKCNNTYLIFNELNNNNLNWKFANQSLFCQQKGKQEAFVNQCDITRIDSKYLKVPVVTSDHYEHACIYCPINYKPISPMIHVTQLDDGYQIVYTFNLTTNELAEDDAFEILWAKRSGPIENSFNYWFLKGCVAPDVHIREDTGHTIIFDVNDISIDRVEFIIRRCNRFCRPYIVCDNDEFYNELSSNNFRTPDSIEKISCDYDCLNGIVHSTTINNIVQDDKLLTPNQLINRNHTIKFLILFPILGLLMIVLFIIFAFFIIYRMKVLRRQNVYTKTGHINVDDNK
ncbi:unnamed protein product [Adineta steineri]|uniref:Uncharacterized protein n=2 Tax=Adineta steineri TaxID=433720 RepID=A0A818P964_9BILA|nr:unnamed protein product [Adineta steineri]CAF3617520.1 unnamed protein product [Adineta steineri]